MITGKLITMRFFYVFIFLICSLCSMAQKIIIMELEGGVYKVPCKVNGLKMKFIFDTGASSVCLSETMATFLLDNGYLSRTDIKGTGKARVADGRTVNNYIVNIKDLEIDGLHLANVTASIIEGQSAPLLLGQSAIQKLGRISIEGNKLVINSAKEKKKLTEAELDKLYDDCYEYYINGSYEAAIEGYIILRESGTAGAIRLFLAKCYYGNKQYKEAVNAYNEYFIYDSQGDDPWTHADAYNELGKSYEKIGDNYNAILNYQKAEKLKPDGYEYKYSIAFNYLGSKKYKEAIEYFKEAINLLMGEMGVSKDDIQEGKVIDDRLGNYLYNYAVTLAKLYKTDEFTEIIRMSALCQDEEAMKFCNENDINYHPRKSLF